MTLSPGFATITLTIPIVSYGETIQSVTVRVPSPRQFKRARRSGVPIETTNIATIASISLEAAANLTEADFVAIAQSFSSLVEATTTAANAITAAGRHRATSRSRF